MRRDGVWLKGGEDGGWSWLERGEGEVVRGTECVILGKWRMITGPRVEGGGGRGRWLM